MTKQEFKRLFEKALEIAATHAEKRLGRPIPRTFQISFYGCGHSGTLVNPEAAIDKLYIDAEKFYRIIDIAIVEVNEGSSTVFVRVSSHTPASFEETWNNPPGMGPFKQLMVETIKTS